ncbi:MAG: hypothetical protein LBQ39_02400 [Tannerellaceae bacterium]|jgi:hypothetical protein|nr:hypothetical protein [Tannerellaceae bacterium]
MKQWSIYILAVFLLGACTTDETPVPTPNHTNPDEKETLVKVVLPGASAPKTYASISEIDENYIKELDVLAFKKAANELDELFSYRIEVDKDSIKANASYTKGEHKTIALRLKGLKEGVRLVFIANARAVVNALALTPTTKKSDILNSLTYDESWQNIAGGGFNPANDFVPFPMWGQTADYIDNTTSDPKVDILRAVARIDIGVNIYGTGPALGFGQNFVIQEVYVREIKKKGYIYPAGSPLSISSVTTPNLYPFTAADSITHTTFHFETISTTDSVMRRRIYVPESNAIPKEASTGATFLVVKATFYNETSYYRINFKSGVNYIPLLRNHLYEVNILNVTSKGYATLQEALDAKTANLETNLIVSDLLIGSSTWNDEYELGVTSQQIIADWMEGDYKAHVETSYPGGWKAVVTDSLTQDWLRLGSKGSDKTVLTGPKSVPATELPYCILEANKTDAPREATILVTAGLLKREIKIRQVIGSNCYIMSANQGATLLIPVNSANMDGNRVGQAKDLRATILWSEPADLIDLDANSKKDDLERSSEIKVIKKGNASYGNAVIALVAYGSTGMVGGNPPDEILWSWHIWIPHGNPGTTMKANNGFFFLDRNLGANEAGETADAYGLYYQWGRKDPFTGSFASTTPFIKEEVTVPDNLDNSIANPTTFYTSSKTPNDWYSSTGSSNNNLWKTLGGNAKTAYDPCPFGWRVPYGTGNLSPWKGFTSNKKNGDTYALAGGLDHAGNAVTLGHVWSASEYNAKAYHFSYTPTSAIPDDYTANRANAFPVRCVRDKYSIALAK